MFDFLRKKIGGFVDSILKKEESKEETKEEKKEESKPIDQTKLISAMKQLEEIKSNALEHLVAESKPLEEPRKEIASKLEHTPEHKTAPKSEPKLEHKPEPALEHKPTPKLHEPKQELPKLELPVAPKKEEKKEEKTFAPKLGFFKQIAAVFSNQVELKESEINPALEELELSLLESDASLETANFVISNLRSQMAGQKVEKKKLSDFVNTCIRSTLDELLSASSPSTSFFSMVEQHKRADSGPFVVLFAGPNGAGKTTTIAKLAFQLKQKGISSVIAAADTFRAAAIQQAEHHGKVIGVKVVKHDYGADPAAVAFDAIAHAKAHNVDVVLIDTAGRQETNVNLVGEMQKLNRVVKPNLKLFVGESLAGHAVIEQVKKFHSAITLDGIILSKLDCDAKGGNALSIANDTKLPIYFVGLGQEYADLVEFAPSVLLNRILAAS